MSGAALDRLLAILLVALLASGLLTLRSGDPVTAPLFWFHGVVGGALLVATGSSLRRSVGPAVRLRRWGRLALGRSSRCSSPPPWLGGFAWVASGRILSIGPWTVLTLHIWAALALVPVVVVHSRRAASGCCGRRRRRDDEPANLPRDGRPGRPRHRRMGRGERPRPRHGGPRRFTGSRWLPAGGVPPPTTFYGEGTPTVDLASWRLRVRGRVERPLHSTWRAWRRSARSIATRRWTAPRAGR